MGARGPPRFFPDTNILFGLVFQEQRFGASNRLFLKLVKQHKLECTILPTIQNEFRDVLKSALDTAEYIVNLFLSKFASSKTDPWDPSKVSTVNVKDTELIEKSFDDTYKELEKLPPEKIEKWKAMFDWVESWVMEEWSELVSKGTTIIIEDFRDTLKQLILEANRILDDNFQKLRLELDNKKCEWNCSADVENRLKTHINRSDAPHLAYASAFPSSSNGGPIFVTNDEGILLKKKDIEKIAKLLVVRPAFAYAYNAMKTSGSMLNK